MPRGCSGPGPWLPPPKQQCVFVELQCWEVRRPGAVMPNSHERRQYSVSISCAVVSNHGLHFAEHTSAVPRGGYCS